MALSADERRLAIGLKHGVQWLGLASGNWLNPPQQAPRHFTEFSGLALDPAGRIAVMRDSERRHWRLDLIRELRSLPECCGRCLTARCLRRREMLSDLPRPRRV